MKQRVDRSAAVSRPPAGRGLDTTDRQRYSFDEDSLGPHFYICFHNHRFTSRNQVEITEIST